MRTLVLSLLLAPLALAGCMGDATSAERLDSGAVVTTPSSSLATAQEVLPAAALAAASDEAPLWNVGDAWAMVSRNGAVEERGFLVVTRDQGDHYVIETTIEQTAAFDAMLDVSYLGKIRKSDLAGYQGTEPIQYFSFPLADGKTWSTTWDGQPITLTATAAARGFAIVGTTEEGESYVEYDYTPDLGWWSRLDFVQDDYGIRIERLQQEWTGTLATATATEVYASEPSLPVASPNSGAFTISEDQTFAMVIVRGGGALWARGFALFEPGGSPYMSSTIGNLEMSDAGAAPAGYAYFEQIPATPGEWRVLAPALHPQDGWGQVIVYEVALASKSFP